VSGLRTVAGGETVGGCAHEAGWCSARCPITRRSRPAPGDRLGEGEIDEPLGEAGVLVTAEASMLHSAAGTDASAVMQRHVTARLPRGFGDRGPNHA
jgi:hypothetical protein